MATLAELRQEYTAARATITALDGELAKEWNEIGDKAFDEDRDLTPEEEARQDQIEETRAELMRRLKDLALGNLRNLNSSEDVDALNAQILAVKEGLDETLEHLENVARYAAAAANIAETVAKVAEKAAGLVL
ncbi:MAG: hypothetical protein MI741_10750 [Rhodospirillales bacterium]|nr:hypothetical protein [Rhodospirillales bacterium]